MIINVFSLRLLYIFLPNNGTVAMLHSDFNARRPSLRLICTVALTLTTSLSGPKEGAAERGDPRLPNRLQGERSRQQRTVQHSGDESYRGQ